ncbi:MAG: hypothetical protein Q8830_02215 [Candidatus Phytoplasma australasiaticum]|nr:hypothetical protein [Candidatus Phytoplasma australasiaticum]
MQYFLRLTRNLVFFLFLEQILFLKLKIIFNIIIFFKNDHFSIIIVMINKK